MNGGALLSEALKFFSDEITPIVLGFLEGLTDGTFTPVRYVSVEVSPRSRVSRVFQGVGEGV